jgi:hypothetical protein
MKACTPTGEARLRRDLAAFASLIGIAEECAAASNLPAAAASAEIAAAAAWRNHPGLFASPRLERLLIDVGRRTAPHVANPTGGSRQESPERVLHVLSKARNMGGDSRFVCRWMEADAGHRHSVAVTSQLDQPIPDPFFEWTSRRGGQVHRLDKGTSDPMARARRLRALALDADFVALHLYPDDIVPVLAFARRQELPPIAFINHSDHTFWLGVSVSDLVVQLRECSIPLSIRRRGIQPERIATLPIPLPPVERTLSRDAAKALLGLGPDQVVLLSVGTEFKYAPAGGPGFLDVLLPVVRQHHQAVLLAVGPRLAGAWGAAHESTSGRVVPLGTRYDTDVLFQAADVYLDSFPFTSPTAALEAGSYGLPLVAMCPHTGDARVLSPGAPGLDASMCRAHDPVEYAATVGRLLADPALRHELGERARQAIDAHHRGASWLQQLTEVYRAAAATDACPVPGGPDNFEADHVDILVNHLYRVGSDVLGGVIDHHVRPLPITSRVAVLRRMLRVNRAFSFDLFLPVWLAARVSWRPPYWGPIRKMLAKHDPPPRTKPCEST